MRMRRHGAYAFFAFPLAIIFFVVPFVAVAQEQSLTDIINTVAQLALLAIPWFLVLVAFFWNLASLLFNISDTEKQKQAKSRIVWAVIAMFVLFTLPGLINLLTNTFFGDGAGGGASSGLNAGGNQGGAGGQAGGNQGGAGIQGGGGVPAGGGVPEFPGGGDGGGSFFPSFPGAGDGGGAFFP